MAFEPDEVADLVAASWLHDIGYAPWLVGIQMHALDGGWFLQERHFPERVCQLVAHHSGARFEARERGLLDRLEWSFPAPDAALLDALTYADMTTSPRGLPVPADLASGKARRPSERSSTCRRSETHGGLPKEDRAGRWSRARYSSDLKPQGSAN